MSFFIHSKIELKATVSQNNKNALILQLGYKYKTGVSALHYKTSKKTLVTNITQKQ